jgi:lipopolysaccharide transport system permease protein
LVSLKKGQLALIIDLTKRDFKVRYLGSFLGAYWNIIHPLVMILIYTIIFSQVMKSRLGENAGPFAYSFYLCSGLLLWNLFNESINRSTTTLLENSAFMRKVSFPAWNMFLVSISTALLNYFIAFAIFSIFLLFIGSFDPLFTLGYLAVVAAMTCFALGIGFLIGCLNVFLRDFQQITTIVLQVWFWFTPVVYLKDNLPEFAKRLLWFNPAFPFIDGAHELLFFNRLPTLRHFGLMGVYVLLALTIGGFVYKKSISSIRDEL